MKYNINDIVDVKVTGIADYGFFVKVDESTKGIIHISEISDYYVRDVKEYAKINQVINVQVIGYDLKNKNNLFLSYKRIRSELLKAKKKQTRIRETPKGFTSLEKELPLQMKRKLGEIRNGQFKNK